jgi:hypothetical protein
LSLLAYLRARHVTFVTARERILNLVRRQFRLAPQLHAARLGAFPAVDRRGRV